MLHEIYKSEGDWDQTDAMTFIEYDVETVVELKGIPIGTKFISTAMDFENGTLEFFDDDDMPVFTFKMKLVVKEI